MATTQTGGALVQNPYGSGVTTTGTNFPRVGGAIANGMITQDGVNPLSSGISSEPVSAGIVGTANPLALPTIPTSSTATALSGMADGVKQGALNQQLKADELAKTNAKNSSQNDFATTVNDILGVQSNVANAEAQAGLPQKGQSLTDATNRLEASQRAQVNELRTIDEQMGIGSEGAALQKQAINRKYAYEQADLALIQSAANRDFATAQSIVNRKIELQLEPLKTKLDYFKQVNIDNREDLTKSQQNTLSNQEKQAQREYETAKTLAETLESTKLGVLKNAAEQGAPASVIAAINSSESAGAALTSAGIYGGDFKRQLEIRKLQKEINQLAGTTGGVPDDLAAYAGQYTNTGKLPSPAELKASGLSVGQVSAMAKQMPKSDGSLVSNTTGVLPSEMSSGQQDGILALYDITKKVAELKPLNEKRTEGLVSATLGKVFGSDDQSNYLALRQEIIDLLSRARTGAALTADEEAFYTSQLPGRVGEATVLGFGQDTSNMIENFDKKIQGTLDTRLSGLGSSIYGYSKVKVGDTKRVVGEILKIGDVDYRVLPDGKLTNVI